MQWARRLLIGLSLAVIPAADAADDVDVILQRWREHHSRQQPKGLHGTARLYIYDEVFEAESRARVEFWLSGPEEWRVDYAPAEIARSQSSVRGPSGKALSLRPLQWHDRWSQSTTELTQSVSAPRGLPEVRKVDLQQLSADRTQREVNPLARFFAALLRPLSEMPSRIAEAIPGVIQLACSGPSSDPDGFELCRPENWNISLGTTHGERGRIHLMLHPKSKPLEHSFSRIEILLKAADFTPIGVRTYDPAGTSSCVYAFEEVDALPYEDDPFGPNSLANWPPQCRPRSAVPPPPPVAIPVAD